MKPLGTLNILLCISMLLPGFALGGIKRIKTKQKVVALTFDDGPNPPYTVKLLNILAEKKVKVTFFLVGKQVELHPESARKIIKAGHELGGHAYGWETLAFKKSKYVNDQLNQMDLAFTNIGITNLTLFRPPNGLLSPGQNSMLELRGLRHISADVVVGDWKEKDPTKLLQRVVKKVRPGSIIVLHDGGGDRSTTLAAVPKIIEALREQGYTFLTVGELLNLK